MLSRQKIEMLDFFVFEVALFTSIACKNSESLTQMIELDLGKHMFTSHILMAQTPPFEILGSSDSVIAQKS